MRPEKKAITSTFASGRSWKFGVKKLLFYDLWSVCRLVMVVGVALTRLSSCRPESTMMLPAGDGR